VVDTADTNESCPDSKLRGRSVTLYKASLSRSVPPTFFAFFAPHALSGCALAPPLPTLTVFRVPCQGECIAFNLSSRAPSSKLDSKLGSKGPEDDEKGRLVDSPEGGLVQVGTSLRLTQTLLFQSTGYLSLKPTDPGRPVACSDSDDYASHHGLVTVKNARSVAGCIRQPGGPPSGPGSSQ
jgi:hypothetical protein